MVSNVYDILGVSSDATPTEVKRAYFKLIRIHTPEGDPEGFQTIREAYEAYQSGNFEGAGEFTYSCDKEKEAAAKIAQFLDRGQYNEAKSMANSELETYPESDHIKYLYCMALRKCKNTTTAVKLIEPLIEKNPNRLFMKEYALACIDRGWNQKAARALARALEEGVHDPEFISRYFVFIDDSNYKYTKEEIVSIFTKYFADPPTRWGENNFGDGFNILYYWNDKYNYIDLTLKPVFESINDMMLQYPAGFGNNFFLIGNIMKDCSVKYMGVENYELMEKCFDTFMEKFSEKMDENGKVDLKYSIRCMKLHGAYNISRQFAFNLFHYYFLKDRFNLPDRFLKLNVQLSILLDEEGFTPEQIDIIAREEPSFYKSFKVTFDKLSLPQNKIDSYVNQLQMDLRKYPYPKFYDLKVEEDFEY